MERRQGGGVFFPGTTGSKRVCPSNLERLLADTAYRDGGYASRRKMPVTSWVLFVKVMGTQIKEAGNCPISIASERTINYGTPS